MIFEHEIPEESRLYFGRIAKLKRNLELKASNFFDTNGFEEIITPNFSYSGHQSIDDPKELITLHDQANNSLALRADSTLDVVRIISKRLGRSTLHKKWFYIQPVFTFPSKETYQIGAEWINHDNISDIINLNCKLLDILNISSFVQIANINIPTILSKEYDIEIDLFKNGEIGKLFDFKYVWLIKLIEVTTKEQLENILDILPECIINECKKLIKIASNITYNNINISPIYYSAMMYYDDIYYKVISNNLTIAKGGGYKSNGITSQGFAIYTDNLLKVTEG